MKNFMFCIFLLCILFIPTARLLQLMVLPQTSLTMSFLFSPEPLQTAITQATVTPIMGIVIQAIAPIILKMTAITSLLLANQMIFGKGGIAAG